MKRKTSRQANKRIKQSNKQSEVSQDDHIVGRERERGFLLHRQANISH